MSGIYQVDCETALFLYAREHNIYMRYKTGPYFGKPTLLAGDYNFGLVEVATTSTLYFAYISTQNTILVKNLSGEIIFSTPFTRIPGANFNFVFSKVSDEPFLLYPASSCADSPLQYTFPLLERQPAPFTPCPGGIKTIHPIVSANRLFLLAVCDNQTLLYCLSDALTPHILLTDNSKELQRLQMQLDSAITQYNELMDVARHYKEEAEKWRGKYWK